MIQTFACDCLNVILHADPEDVSQEDVNYARHLINSISDQTRGEISPFLTNSRLVKLSPDQSATVKTRHPFLCLKRNIANWQFYYCAICEKETHAIPLNGNSRDAANNTPLALLSSLLLDDENKINMLKSDAKYSVTFDIILPRSTSYPNSTSGGIYAQRVNDFIVDNTLALDQSDIDLEISEKVKQFLYHQRRTMEDRIKNFALEENRIFEELCQKTQDEKNDFLHLVETIKQRHDLIGDSDSFDKENNSELTAEKIDTRNFSTTEKGGSFFEEANMFEISADYLRKQNAQSDNLSKQKNRTADFDGLFDMDDIDVDANSKFGNAFGKEELNRFAEEEEGEAEEAEEKDVFPLKEANNTYSTDVDGVDDILPLSRSSGINMIMSSQNSSMRTRKVASSVVQNIPYPHQSKNRYTQQTTPNSLPIKIPHLRSRMTDLDNDEGQQIEPGESIADRIQKLARSVRNETDILDDRPRRPRLNTGDLIKSRPILN